MTEPKKCNCVKEPTETVNVARFIAKLDGFFSNNDLKSAGEHLRYWMDEAKKLGDDRGLLSIANEALGFARRIKDSALAEEANEICLRLLSVFQLEDHLSGAAIFVNAATTQAAFGKPEEGLPLYEKAENVYLAHGREKSYEYAALLNNRASALNDLKRFDESESAYRQAVEILKEEGKHDGEIAVSLINLAHLTFDRDDTSYVAVEALLDKAWDYINSRRQPHDQNYAFILSKCAPSLDYFCRKEEADACREVAKEIYERH